MIARLRKAFHLQLLPLALGFILLAAIVGSRSWLIESQHDENDAVQSWAQGSVEQIEAALKQSRAGESTKQPRWWHSHELMLARLARASQLNRYSAAAGNRFSILS